MPLCRFATRRVGTHVGKDLSRFSLSSNVTRLARLQVGNGGGERGRQTGSVKTGAVGGGERGGEAAWLVRWRVCASGLPGTLRGLAHLSERGGRPE